MFVVLSYWVAIHYSDIVTLMTVTSSFGVAKFMYVRRCTTNNSVYVLPAIYTSVICDKCGIRYLSVQAGFGDRCNIDQTRCTGVGLQSANFRASLFKSGFCLGCRKIV